MILALDLGTKLGWAGGVERYVKSGTIHLPDESVGHRMLHFGHWFSGQAWLTACYYEAPHCPSMAARDIIYGLQGILLCECVKRGIDAHRISANTLKKWATGSGKAGKIAMAERASEIAGRKITDYDEADAICLLGMALELEVPPCESSRSLSAS